MFGALVANLDLTPDNLIDTSSYTRQVVGGDFAVWRDYIDSGQTLYVWYGQKINHKGHVGEKFKKCVFVNYAYHSQYCPNKGDQRQ